MSEGKIDNICSVVDEFLYGFNAVLAFHAFKKLESTWQILIKQLWFWRIVWNLKSNLSHILNPYTFEFWIFYFMHFEVLSMNFEIFNVLFSLFVHICIVSFQKKIQTHFELLCLYDFVDVISSCFVSILIWTFISIKYILFMFCFLPFCISLKKIHMFCFLYFYLFCNVSFINLVMKILPLYFKS